MPLMRVSKRPACAGARRTPTRRLPLSLFLGAALPLVAATTACARAAKTDAATTAPTPVGSTHVTGRRVITRAEIDGTTATDAEDVVRLLRPEWLLAQAMSESSPRRGPDTLLPNRRNASPPTLAYVYVSPRGECSPVPMPIARVTRMEFVRPGATEVVLGHFAAAGAVLVFVDDTTKVSPHD